MYNYEFIQFNDKLINCNSYKQTFVRQVKSYGRSKVKGQRPAMVVPKTWYELNRIPGVFRIVFTRHTAARYDTTRRALGRRDR